MTMMGERYQEAWRAASFWNSPSCGLTVGVVFAEKQFPARQAPLGSWHGLFPHPGPFLFSVRLPLQASRPRAGTRAGHGRASWVMLRWVAPSRILVRSLLS